MPTKSVVLVAEDELSISVLERLVQEYNPTLCVHLKHVTRGFGNIKNSIDKYIQASKVIPHIILTDQDNYPCAVELMSDWGVGNLPINCVFRVAVKEVEAWLLADRVGFAQLLNIAVNKIPSYPEQEPDPKQTLLSLARISRNRLARNLLPAKSSLATIGPLYNQILIQFSLSNWNIESASENSDSLCRAILRISEL